MGPSVASYHVFIERPRDPGGPAVTRLAEAVAARYGLPATQLSERLATGRLRVKASVDRETAETFASDLERLGAVCSIVDAATGAPLAKPAPRPASAPAAPAAPRVPTPSPYASGLSAASTPAAAQDLGALASSDFALSTLDGKNDVDPDGPSRDALPASFGPPAEPENSSALPASMGPAIPPAPRPTERGAPASSAPLDLFAPPDAAGEPELALDVDPRHHRGGTTAPAPPPPPQPGSVAAAPATAPTSGGGLAGWIRDRRLQLAAGVAAAILLGFVPATVVASLRESSNFDRIDAEVRLHYKGVKTEADYRKLDPWLATQHGAKRDTKRNIALGSMLIWALTGAGVAFVWFRKIDWDRVADRFDA